MKCEVLSYNIWLQNLSQWWALFFTNRLSFVGFKIPANDGITLLNTITDCHDNQGCQLVMGREQNLREFNVNVISLLTICVKRKICEWQYYPFFVNLRVKLVNFCLFSHEIAEITWIEHKCKFITKNWSRMWFHLLGNIRF